MGIDGLSMKIKIVRVPLLGIEIGVVACASKALSHPRQLFADVVASSYHVLCPCVMATIVKRGCSKRRPAREPRPLQIGRGMRFQAARDRFLKNARNGEEPGGHAEQAELRGTNFFP